MRLDLSFALASSAQIDLASDQLSSEPGAGPAHCLYGNSGGRNHKPFVLYFNLETLARHEAGVFEPTT